MNRRLKPFLPALHLLRKILPGFRRIFASREAKDTHEELYADVRSVSVEEWSRFASEVRALCKEREYAPEFTESWVSHRCRLYFTLQWLVKALEGTSRAPDVLEMGTASVVTDLVRRRYPQVRLQNTTGDLRSSWGFPDQTFDLILCTEVLEHLSDLPEGFGDTFWGTGLKAALQEARRVLKPGGAILITTPNAASILHLHHALAGEPPWFYPLHVREYTVKEMLTELQQAGFAVQEWRTIHCMTIDQQTDYSFIYQLLLEYSYQVTDRGDDLFILARRSG